MEIIFIVSKALVIEYTVIRQWWPEQLHEARYVDNGPNRTYIIESALTGEMFELLMELSKQSREYRILDLKDQELDLPEVNLDNETHHFPTEPKISNSDSD